MGKGTITHHLKPSKCGEIKSQVHIDASEKGDMNY
jgi:hypothetical protein